MVADLAAVTVPDGPKLRSTAPPGTGHRSGSSFLDFATAAGDAPGNERWSFQVVRDAFPAPGGSDAALVAQGKIVIVPMRVDEADPEMSAWLRQNRARIPHW
ncbi:MAG: hypothetical protein ACYC6F_07560 [Longimicrobiales bacterium]